MRIFVDLHLKPGAQSEMASILETAEILGFSGIAITNTGNSREAREGLDVISRIDLKPRNQRDLGSSLKRVRRRYEIVSVECASKPVARQAAKDHRVDILNFSPSASNRRKVGFDHQEASLASGANCSYEVNACDILGQGPLALSKLLPILRREVENARRYDVPVVLSSGAVEPLLMRGPRDLAALMGLIGREVDWLDAVSTNPWRMVERNREKLSPGFVVPGVKVV
jgi:ribonuclease P/MRP protein subunit RPP1